jgi:hypothetical protein
MARMATNSNFSPMPESLCNTDILYGNGIRRNIPSSVAALYRAPTV